MQAGNAHTRRLETRHVFIDTSIFVSTNFHYKSSTFKWLIARAKEGRLVVHLTTITIGEIEANIRERVENAYRAIQRSKREAMVLRNLPDSTYQSFFSDFDAKTAEATLIEQFKKFISDSQAHIIQVSGASIDRVFGQYFSSSPPFGTGKKKSEFPDAFILAALREWCASKGEKMYVISGDRDMVSACEAEEMLIHLTSVDALLNMVTAENKQLTAFALSALHHLEASISEKIIEKFRWLGFILDDEDGVVEDPEAITVSIEDRYLTFVTDEYALFKLDVVVDYTVEVAYDDPSSGIYDREDDRVLYRETIDETLERATALPVEVRISFDKRDKPESAVLDDVSIEISDVYVYVNEGHY